MKIKLPYITINKGKQWMIYFRKKGSLLHFGNNFFKVLFRCIVLEWKNRKGEK